MSRLVLTGYAGSIHSKLAEITVPLMIRYANAHADGFECRNLFGPRPPAWMKVPAIYNALEQFDVVLWIDVDVVIADSSACIFDAIADDRAIQALVEHKTNCGEVPNSGVWIASSEMRSHLKEMWDAGDNIDHPWWEQASLIARMGYEVRGTSASRGPRTPMLDATEFLPPEWNHHPHDDRKVPEADAKFIHVTQYDNRFAAAEFYAGIAR